ncbi:MAG: GCN5-related N-acetyltransferase [Verrucomicrobia bacterium]|nr:GCN5-related N-acetyltransferase [Verrucomicrobiota bacterium]
MSVEIQTMGAADWAAVRAIYEEGIATGHATFAPAAPENFPDFSEGRRMDCALVAKAPGDGMVLGWATLAPVSDRCVYAGVAEVSVYVAVLARGRGVGSSLVRALIERADSAGVWTLQAGIFPENSASLALHARHGFRTIGSREKVGKMTHGPLAGFWRDTILLERRSAVAGRD